MMKHRGIITLLTILLSSFMSAQKHYDGDTTVIDKLNNLGWKLRDDSLERSKALALWAIDEARKINYSRGLSYSYNILGYYYKMKSRYDSAFHFYLASFDIRKNNKDTLGMSSCYRNIMSIHKSNGDYKKAIETGLLALKLLEGKNAPSFLVEKGKVLIALSTNYTKTSDYTSAVKNILEARKIFEAQDDKAELSKVANELGSLYRLQEKFDEALAEYKKVVVLNIELDNKRDIAKGYNNIGNIYYDLLKDNDALRYYKKAYDIRKAQGFEDDLPGSLLNIGIVFMQQKKFDSAMIYCRESLALSKKSGNAEGQYEAYRTLGAIYRNKGNFPDAISHLKKAYVLSSKEQNIHEILNLLDEIKTTYRNFGQPDSALFYSEQYAKLNDSLDKIIRSTMELENTLKLKEKELTIGYYKLRISEEQNRSKNYIIISILVAIAFASFFYFKSQSAKKHTLKLQELIKEQEQKALDAMIEGQESERKKLAAELHDTIGSILSAIKFAFKSLEVLITGGNYKKINAMLDEALQTVRRISHDMASGVVLEKGIGKALAQLCETLEQSGKLQIKLDMYGFDEKVDPVVELNLYRILQELLTNTIRHSQALNVSIQLIKSKDSINLVMIDDGKGFDPQSQQVKHGIGLSNVDKRVQNLSGKWDIDSGKGKGTTIVIDIPLNDPNT